MDKTITWLAGLRRGTNILKSSDYRESQVDRKEHCKLKK